MILINFFLFSSKRTKWWIIHGVKRGRDLLSVSTHTLEIPRLTCLMEFPRCLLTITGNHSFSS